MTAAIQKMTSDFEALDPAQAAQIAQSSATHLNTTLATYHSLLASIKATYAGTPVGGSESIIVYLMDYLGLKIMNRVPFR